MGRQKTSKGRTSKRRGTPIPAADYAWDRITPAVETARERIGPAVKDVRERITPVVEDARERITPAVESARNTLVEDVVPKVASAVTSAVAATEPYRAEARRRGSVAVAALKGEIDTPPARRKSRWLARLLVVSALGGAAYAAYRYLTGGSDQRWQPMPAPAQPSPTRFADATPSRTGAPSTEPGRSSRGAERPSDEAGATPGEAVANHSTTPPHEAGQDSTPAGQPAAQEPEGRSTRSRAADDAGSDAASPAERSEGESTQEGSASEGRRRRSTNRSSRRPSSSSESEDS